MTDIIPSYYASTPYRENFIPARVCVCVLVSVCECVLVSVCVCFL